MYFCGSCDVLPFVAATLPRLAAAWARARFLASSRESSFVGVEMAKDFGRDFFCRRCYKTFFFVVGSQESK